MSNNKYELEQKYLETTYSVFIKDKQYDINIGKPLPQDIKRIIEQEKFAVILTAWNPLSQPLPSSENYSRNNDLASKIIEHTFYKSIGQGVDASWLAEESFFILGMERQEADKLAVEFGQYAYVWLEKGAQVSLVFSEHW